MRFGLLDRYILKIAAGAAVILLVGLTSVIWVTQALREVDLITGDRPNRVYPIPIDKLRVFPEDSDIPKDELNTTIDEHFVPMAKVSPPKKGAFDAWKANLMAELKRVTFGCFPERIPAATLGEQVSAELAKIETEPGIVVPLRSISTFKPAAKVKRVVLVVRNPESKEPVTEFMHRVHEPGDRRNIGYGRGARP